MIVQSGSARPRGGAGSTRPPSRARRRPASSTRWRSRCSSGRRTPSRRPRAGTPSAAASSRRASPRRRRRGRARSRRRRRRRAGRARRRRTPARAAPRRAARSSTASAPRVVRRAVVGVQQRPQRLAHLPRGREVVRGRRPSASPLPVEPLRQAGRVVEQVGAVLEVDAVDERLHEPEPTRRRLAAAGMDEPRQRAPRVPRSEPTDAGSDPSSGIARRRRRLEGQGVDDRAFRTSPARRRGGSGGACRRLPLRPPPRGARRPRGGRAHARRGARAAAHGARA